jgi:hypothetical protein
MITASAINRLPQPMRAALRDLMAHGRLLFMAGHYETPTGERHRADTVGALVSRGIVALTTPQPRHTVARLTAPGRILVCEAAGYEADALASAALVSA